MDRVDTIGRWSVRDREHRNLQGMSDRYREYKLADDEENRKEKEEIELICRHVLISRKIDRENRK